MLLKIMQKIKHVLCGEDSIYSKKYLNKNGISYTFNSETGIINIDLKLERVKNGGCFEWPDMVCINQAIGNNFLSSDLKRVINIGSGVGTFENENAKKFPTTSFYACEMDLKSTNWARENRNISNVHYITDDMATILNSYDKFDMSVCIDVIEHVKDYKIFLDEFSKLSDRAIISTPNRDRNPSTIYKPLYEHHVQEFNAGELFFILKMYYKNVELYSAPDVYGTELIPVGIYSTYDKLIAVCSN